MPLIGPDWSSEIRHNPSDKEYSCENIENIPYCKGIISKETLDKKNLSISSIAILIELYPCICIDLRHEFSNEIVGNFLGVFKSDTALSNIRSPPQYLLISTRPPLESIWITRKPHIVEMDSCFSRGKIHERKWKGSITVISTRVE